MGLDGVEVAPFGPKLCQNVGPRLRIIFQALLGPKTKLEKHCGWATPNRLEVRRFSSEPQELLNHLSKRQPVQANRTEPEAEPNRAQI